MYPRFLQFGHVVLSTYGVLALVAAWSAVGLWVALGRRLGLDADRIQSAGLFAVVSVLAGSRLAVAAENWRGMLEAPLLILITGTVRSNEAAVAGILLATVVCIAYLLRIHVPLAPALASGAPAAMLALAVFDIADFSAGAHYGAPTTMRWGVTYSSRFAARLTGVPLGVPLHPVQLYAALAHFTLAAALILLLQRALPLEVIGTALAGEGVLRFLLAPLAGDYADAATVFHVVTSGQAVAMLLLLGGAACWLRRRESTPSLQHARGEAEHV